MGTSYMPLAPFAVKLGGTLGYKVYVFSALNQCLTIEVFKCCMVFYGHTNMPLYVNQYHERHIMIMKSICRDSSCIGSEW